MQLIIPEGRFEGYLFDMDGTIANTLPLHLKAWRSALAPHDLDMPEDLFYAWGGIPVPRTVEMLNEHFQKTMPIDAVVKAREEAYLAMLPLVETHAAVEAIIRASHKKIPMAVVSGSSREVVELTLRRLKIWELFEGVIGAEDCKRGKPYPDPFLAGAKLLQVDPRLCLAFEDAEPGIQSAMAAGMQVVRIPQRP